MENLLNFLTDNWEYITPLVLWFATRFIKTQRNYDFVEIILKFIGQYIIPNRRKSDAKTNYYKGNNTGKFPLVFLIMLSVPILSNAQLNGNFKSVRFVNAGSNEANIPTTAGNGAIYYNEGTQTFRAFQNGVWQDLIGGGGIVTASNGLNVVGNDVRMGGAITETTTLTGLEEFTINTDSIQIISPSGARLFLQSTGNFAFNLSTGVIADFNGAPTGLTYAADYTAGFTARNLVDRGFVDTQLGGFLSGTLSSDATLQNPSNTFTFENGDAGITNTGSLSFNQTSLASQYLDPTLQLITTLSQTNSAISLAAQNALVTSTVAVNSSGFSYSDGNALATLQPSGFSIDFVSENGDMNINGDAINITGRSITTGATPSSPITIITGAQTALGNTGALNLLTGNSTTVTSGDINITSGTGDQDTGSIALTTGNAP